MDFHTKTYHPAKQKTLRALSWACLLFACIPLASIAGELIAGNQIDASLIRTIAIFFLIFSPASLLVHLWSKATLTISSTGLSCKDIAVFESSSTHWENISDVFSTKNGLVVVLKEPAILTGKFARVAVLTKFKSPRIINLSSFIDHWNNGDLKKDFEEITRQAQKTDSYKSLW